MRNNNDCCSVCKSVDCCDCEVKTGKNRKPTKSQRRLMAQRRKVTRRLGGEAKGFFAAAS